MDLINGKTIYCPECGKELTELDGKINLKNPKLANANGYCGNCDKHYHWIAYVSTKPEKHSVSGFRHYFPSDKIKSKF